jgi:endonuclease/exonuclease/phosphatase family metal-dependent hydrolase
MRIASYNVENLFARAKALNLDTWAEGRPILERFAELNELFEEEVYTDDIKRRMLQLLKDLKIDKANDSKFVTLRENRGQLTRYSTIGGTRIVAGGRADWVGWLELKTEVINETATRNTAQVVRDIDADVVGVVECESRNALQQFSTKLLPSVGAGAYEQTMLIDGNDDRGIDVGLMATRGHRIGWMRSHVDDQTTTGERVFSRDCPEYSIWAPSGEVVWLLINHFKSKGYGTKDASDRKRWLQAETVRLIYERLKAEGAQHIVVMGDLNDDPSSEALRPLLADSGLRDISEHEGFQHDGRPGTYQRGGAKEKLDYILLSPALFARMQRGGVWRKGVWGPNKSPAWEVYPEMKTPYHAASDHAALWCDVAV